MATHNEVSKMSKTKKQNMIELLMTLERTRNSLTSEPRRRAIKQAEDMLREHAKIGTIEHDKLYMVKVPVYDIMTDETKAVEMPRKKPGRKESHL
jgi:uncharacterized secreted protein with C-terminal beta-propeller domain